LVVLASGVVGSQAEAVTYYISPSGSDSNSGTSSTSPWKTFNNAVRKLQAGDSLVVKNGTYNASNSGYLHVACGTNAVNGTASRPITIRAETERQAWIKSDGLSNPAIIRNCAYWIVEGLRFSTADNANAKGPGGAVLLYNMSNFTFRRNLLQYNNRYKNGSIFATESAMTNSLVEENEFYDYHRNGVAIAMGSNNNVIRRNYINSRGRLDIPGGYPSAGPGGDSGFACYPCNNNIFENNIIEDMRHGFDMLAAGITRDNRSYGDIVLNGRRGVALTARGDTAERMPQRNHFYDFVGIGNSEYGFSSASSKESRCDNCSLIDNGGGLRAVRDPNVGFQGDGIYSVFSDNTLSYNNNTNSNINKGLIVDISNGSWTFLIDYMNSFGHGTNLSPAASHASITNEKTIDPKLGTCKVWIPDGSPMKGVGKSGRDIGANVLYRYEKGVLTSQPLWNPSTGEFPGGAIVSGVNDIAGSSRFDVHTRLNVNTNGCAFPAGYGSAQVSSSPPQAPGNLSVIIP
jgi:hypothetical protein